MNRPEIFDSGSATAATETGRLSVADLLRLLRRQARVIIVTTLAALLIAGAYVATAKKLYTAEITLLIDPRRLQIFRQDSVTTDPVFDSATLESQLETLKSENVIRLVIRNLRLHEDPDFVGEEPTFPWTLINSLIALIDPPVKPSEEQKIQAAVDAFKKRIDVRRSGLSYAITVRFTAATAANAARIANEIGEAYAVDQISSRFELTNRATVWLQERIRELQVQASEGEHAVTEFKARNQIVDANGRLISEVQLQEAQTQESAARQLRQEAKARLDRVREITAQSSVLDATVADTLKSEIFIRLRQDYLELARREADWSARFGANHQSVIQLRGDIRRIERSMQEELKRLEQTYDSDFQIALAKEAAIRNDIEQLNLRWNETRQAQIRLRELESIAQQKRQLHDTLVQRYNLAVQQQSFPISDGRVITAATPPARPSWPRRIIILLGALLAGLGLGGVIALFREMNDQRIRTLRDLESEGGVDSAGILPIEERRSNSKKAATAVVLDPVKPDDRFPKIVLPESNPMMSRVIRQPFGAFAETCRNVKVAVDMARMLRDIRKIGIASPGPGEGKTTTCCNIGLLMARAGHKVLVIDADLRRPKLTQTLMPDADKGLVEVLLGKTPLESVLWREPVTGCYFLPTVLTRRLSNTSELLTSTTMQQLLARAEAEFDYVLLDCPPIAPVADVRSFAHLVDGFVLVAAWGETKIDLFRRVARADFMRTRLISTVLTKVDMKHYKLFEAYNEDYYSQEYARYT